MTTPADPPKRLYRNVDDALVAGVAAGLADYLHVDRTLVRVIFALVILFTFFTGLLAYLVMWLLIPPRPPEARVRPAAG